MITGPTVAAPNVAPDYSVPKAYTDAQVAAEVTARNSAISSAITALGSIPKVYGTTATLDASGKYTWTFPVPLNSKPVMSYDYFEAETTPDKLPVSLRSIAFGMTSGKYTSVTVKGTRFQTLPAVIGLLGALAGFNPFAGAAPQGLEISIIAVG